MASFKVVNAFNVWNRLYRWNVGHESCLHHEHRKNSRLVIYTYSLKSKLSCQSLHSVSSHFAETRFAESKIAKFCFSILLDFILWNHKVTQNALPLDVRSPHNSRQQFQSKLKTYLFRQAYNTAWVLLARFLWEQFVTVTVTSRNNSHATAIKTNHLWH